ncbi:uncharacterized protein LOC108622853 isoform X2 [Ceratina calcarata]|uniref:Uncharacterized protein LOC108622853 isoform X2 n=1 Tax=Ceratina calcarata TaxID=156304 RepID=A0AAJ7RXW0_9HYME|nr:uncharacterized protein LOC108622853 isoform X2 [Ceratina calcarata]
MNILRCSSCKMFQSHIVKKAKKWQCKMCNFKQAFSQIRGARFSRDAMINEGTVTRITTGTEISRLCIYRFFRIFRSNQHDGSSRTVVQPYGRSCLQKDRSHKFDGRKLNSAAGA